MKPTYIIFSLCLITAGCIHKNISENNIYDQDDTQHSIDENSKEQNQADQEKTDEVTIQFLKEMVTYKNLSTMGTEMAIQMMATQGASMANAYITSQAQLLSTKINRDSQTIQTSMQSFQNKSQKAQQTKLQNMISAFSQAQKNIQAQIAQENIISNLELDYLYKNISLDQPQKNYIFNQIQFDQLFTLGTMLTPARALWKNPFSVGDWEYDKDTNSFWQYQSSPIFNNPTDEHGQQSAPSSLQAENNSIFTEYFTDAQQYNITGTMTIYRTEFPCFIGIIFNKARWISGSFESLRKSRMIGVYATSPVDFDIYFAQQFTMNDKQIKESPNDDPIQTPLQQIINKKIKKQISLPHEIFAHINNQPVTIDFTIINSAQSVTCIISCQDHEPMTFTVNNLDPDFFMYHGIGFISPGAVAQFTLKEPTDLIFTAQDVSNFKD